MKTRIEEKGSKNDSTTDLLNSRYQICKELVNLCGQTYADAFSIDLQSVDSTELFKWLMASILLISKLNDVEALDTYKEFEKKGVTSTESVINLKYKKLVALLNRTGHNRYDDRTALRLKNIALVLRDDYGNDLNELHFAAANERDLEKKLRNLGDGIHNSSVHIFLRELRGLWEKAEPFLPNAALFAAKNLGLTNSLSTSFSCIK